MLDNKTEEYVALDVGTKRTGLARGNTSARLAQALKTVPTDQVVAELKSMNESLRLAGLVLGLPRNLSGDDTAQTRWVRDWAQSAKAQIDLPFYWQDEALTSANVPDKNGDTDAQAAAQIMQDFLDTPANERLGF